MSEEALIFVKYPQAGRVKTRLARRLGADGAAEMYRCFVMDTLDALLNSNSHIRVCYHPADKKEDFIRWLGDGYTFMAQRGKSLGERLRDCFDRAFADGVRRALVVGSDSPELSADILRRAFDRLSDHDCVIGPCHDGGYYLLGFRSETFQPEVFEGIPWSTPKVFDTTTSIISRSGSSCCVLEKLHDVDTPEDLDQLAARSTAGTLRGSRTLHCLNKVNTHARRTWP